MIDSSCQGIFFQNNRLEAYFNFFGAANEEEVNEVNKRGFQAQCLKITGKSLISQHYCERSEQQLQMPKIENET